MSEPARLTISTPTMNLELVPVMEHEPGVRQHGRSTPIPNFWALPGGGRATTAELGDLCRRRGWFMQDPHLA